MIIYSITQDYEAPFSYYISKSAAEWALANKFDSNYHYIEEIEVIE